MDDTKLFEDLLQIWDFSTGFNDYLELKVFRLEDLYAALTYSGEEEVGLLTEIYSAFVDCLVWDVPEEETEDNETLLWLIKEYNEEKIKLFWPELLRILL
jgi:hypothetical protein